LNVSYIEGGPPTGTPALLLHGWPDDAHTFDELSPALHRAGYRTIAPWLRGFGSTRFRSDATMRSGQMVAMAQDALDLADTLGIDRFAVIGHDWGARIAYILAALLACLEDLPGCRPRSKQVTTLTCSPAAPYSNADSHSEAESRSRAVTGPREFDRDVALQEAMLVFWRKGFLATSMNDLCDAMGIRSPSLHATFGSKEALYIEAVGHYAKTIGPSTGGVSQMALMPAHASRTSC
jgi:pimeloyl-ACP methyl ester carboxylesterase